MGYPRHLTVSSNSRAFYHCTTRCVRRAFLCGEDPITGRNFDHRKQWIEDRLFELSKVFAVALHAFAVMSNHVHVVLELDPLAPQSWSDDEVARRWLTLFGPRTGCIEKRIALLSTNSLRLAELRARLGSLSWFMRCLNEPIARRANREDECKGRFWEGRFKHQRPLEETDVLGCMTYVDLNPIRAGTARSPETSRHTSIFRRCQTSISSHEGLFPLMSGMTATSLPITAVQYLELVDWTGRNLYPGKLGHVPRRAPTILARLGIRPQRWLDQVPATESEYRNAIGSAEALVNHAKACGLNWLCGLGFARRLARSSAR